MNSYLLKPCPFCGSNTIEIKTNGGVSNGKVWHQGKYVEYTSVSLIHWCEPNEGLPSQRIERVGKDMQSAFDNWNLRSYENKDLR